MKKTVYGDEDHAGGAGKAEEGEHMRRTFWLAGALAVGFANIVALGANGAVDYEAAATEQALRARLAAFDAAFVAADSDALEGLLSARYMHTNTDGSTHDRNSWLGWVSSRRPAVKSGHLSFDRYETSDVRIVMLGDTAIVTGENYADGIDSSSRFSRRIRFSHVWTLEKGSWKRILFHDSRLTP